jgi:hypothetical protein
MRNPSLHKSLELSNDRGLSNYLSGEGTRVSLIRPCSVANLKVMTAGPTPPSPVDLLMGPKLMVLLDKAQELGFEQVVIDAPPILGIADALVLGNQIQSLLFRGEGGQHAAVVHPRRAAPPAHGWAAAAGPGADAGHPASTVHTTAMKAIMAMAMRRPLGRRARPVRRHRAPPGGWTERRADSEAGVPR